MTTSRITITIPGDLVAEADRKATELDRSRSWVLTEALRRYLAAPENGGSPRGSVGIATVRESVSPYLVHGLGPQRMAQLRADLSLDPEERVRAAEDAARSGEPRGGEPTLDQVITFRSMEDFHRWERREALGRAVSEP